VRNRVSIIAIGFLLFASLMGIIFASDGAITNVKDMFRVRRGFQAVGGIVDLNSTLNDIVWFNQTFTYLDNNQIWINITVQISNSRKVPIRIEGPNVTIKRVKINEHTWLKFSSNFMSSPTFSSGTHKIEIELTYSGAIRKPEKLRILLLTSAQISEFNEQKYYLSMLENAFPGMFETFNVTVSNFTQLDLTPYSLIIDPDVGAYALNSANRTKIYDYLQNGGNVYFASISSRDFLSEVYGITSLWMTSGFTDYIYLKDNDLKALYLGNGTVATNGYTTPFYFPASEPPGLNGLIQIENATSGTKYNMTWKGNYGSGKVVTTLLTRTALTYRHSSSYYREFWSPISLKLLNWLLEDFVYARPTATEKIPIIFRIDDVSDDPSRINVTREWVDTLAAFGAKLDIMVIPNSLPNMPSNFRSYLRDLFDSGYVVGLHGGGISGHVNFSSLSFIEQYNELERAIEYFEKYLGFTPNVFAPPYNEYNSDTVRAMDEFGLTLLTADDYYWAHSQSTVGQKMYGNVYHLGATKQVYIYLNYTMESRDWYWYLPQIFNFHREGVRFPMVVLIHTENNASIAGDTLSLWITYFKDYEFSTLTSNLPVIFEPYVPLTFIFGVSGIFAMFVGPAYCIHMMKKGNYMEALVNGFAITAIGVALFVSWLWA